MISFEVDLVVLQSFVHKPTVPFSTKVAFASFDRGSHAEAILPRKHAATELVGRVLGRGGGLSWNSTR